MKFSPEVQSVLEVAQSSLFERVPESEILAIYVKGSQAHGMTNAESDIDLVVILSSGAYISVVYDIRHQIGPTTQPNFSFSAYTLRELQTGKFEENRPPIPGVSRFVKHLDALPLIYGHRPEGPLFTRTDAKDLEVNIRNFFTIYIPGYESGVYQFKDMVKQVLWLAEAEARVLGAIVAHSWQDSVAALPEAHIAHEALHYRVTGDPSSEKQKEFMEKLKIHLSTFGTPIS